jgi:hypothetical protein
VTRPKADIIGSADGSIIITDIATHIAMVVRRSVELVAHMSIMFTEVKMDADETSSPPSGRLVCS